MAQQEKIQDILNDLKDLETRLRETIPFFANEGNLFLLSNNKVNNENLQKYYANLCRLNTDHRAQQYLLSHTQILEILLKELQTLIGADLPFSKQIFTKPAEYDVAAEICQYYAAVKQSAQMHLTQLYGLVLPGSWSWKKLPQLAIQADFVSQISKIDFNQDEIFLEFASQGMIKEGIPNLSLIKNAEQASHTLKINLSSQTEALQLLEKLEMSNPESEEYPEIREVCFTAFVETYQLLYQFIYGQMQTVGLPAASAIHNLELRYKDIKLFILQNLEKLQAVYLNDLAISNKTRIIKQFQTINAALAKFITLEFWNPKLPKIYEIELRASNEFEELYYFTKVSADIYLTAELSFGAKLNLSTFGLSFGPELLQLANYMICGESADADAANSILDVAELDAIDLQAFNLRKRVTSKTDLHSQANLVLSNLTGLAN